MLTSGQVWSGLYVAKNATGAITTPSVGPTGKLYVDGVANAAVVAITGTNPYYWSVTLPTISTAGTVSLYITATIGGVATAEIVAEEETYSGNAATSGTNILTATEGATVLRCLNTDQNMLDLLPMVDKYIYEATGWHWESDTTIEALAKGAARMLLVRWHEDPGGMVAGETLGQGLRAVLSQLEALALDKLQGSVPTEALSLVSSVPSEGSTVDVAVVIKLVFSWAMAAGSTAQVTLKDSSGATVTTTKALDASARVMTLTPAASLTASSSYTVDVDYAADVLGRTVDGEVGFGTS